MVEEQWLLGVVVVAANWSELCKVAEHKLTDTDTADERNEL